MKDKMSAGAVAGIIGAIPAVLLMRLLIKLGVTKHGFSDLAELLIIGRDLHNITGDILGIFGQGINSALVGVLYSILITRFPWNPYFKGIGLNCVLWMYFLAFATVFRIKEWTSIPVVTSISLLAASILLGIVMVYSYVGLTRRSGHTYKIRR